MATDFSIGTVTKKAARGSVPLFVLQTTLQLPEVYVAGGVDVTTALAAIGKAKGHTPVDIKVEPIAGYYFGYNRTTGKVLAYVASTGAECAAGVNLSAHAAVPCTVMAE